MKKCLSILFLFFITFSYTQFNYTMKKYCTSLECINYCLSVRDLNILAKKYLADNDATFFKGVEKGIYNLEDFSGLLSKYEEESKRWSLLQMVCKDSRSINLSGISGPNVIEQYIAYIHMICGKYAKTRNKAQFIRNVAVHLGGLIQYIYHYYKNINLQDHPEILDYKDNNIEVACIIANPYLFNCIVYEKVTKKIHSCIEPLQKYVLELQKHCPNILKGFNIAYCRPALQPYNVFRKVPKRAIQSNRYMHNNRNMHSPMRQISPVQQSSMRVNNNYQMCNAPTLRFQPTRENNNNNQFINLSPHLVGGNNANMQFGVTKQRSSKNNRSNYSPLSELNNFIKQRNRNRTNSMMNQRPFGYMPSDNRENEEERSSAGFEAAEFDMNPQTNNMQGPPQFTINDTNNTQGPPPSFVSLESRSIGNHCEGVVDEDDPNANTTGNPFANFDPSIFGADVSKLSENNGQQGQNMQRSQMISFEFENSQNNQRNREFSPIALESNMQRQSIRKISPSTPDDVPESLHMIRNNQVNQRMQTLRLQPVGRRNMRQPSEIMETTLAPVGIQGPPQMRSVNFQNDASIMFTGPVNFRQINVTTNTSIVNDPQPIAVYPFGADSALLRKQNKKNNKKKTRRRRRKR